MDLSLNLTDSQRKNTKRNMGHIRIKSLITEDKTFDRKAFYQTSYLKTDD